MCVCVCVCILRYTFFDVCVLYSVMYIFMMYIYLIIYICRSGFKKRKVIHHFWSLLCYSDSQSANNNSLCKKNLANCFAKVIRNYPKSESHLAMQIGLFPALCICIYVYINI